MKLTSFDKIKLIKFKKYNFDLEKVIGVKNNQKYILFLDRKLIRIYRDKLKSKALLSSYINIEEAIIFSFNVEKSVVSKLSKSDLKEFIETKVYEEAGIEEAEEYEIKFKIVDKLKDDKNIKIETVIVSHSKINSEFEYILKETGYIDYISFPAFSYKSLYDEKILKEGDDLFVVILEDKVFLTFYSEGELVYINTLTGGLDKVFNSLSQLKIKNFSFDLFKKLLLKKGLNIGKYSSYELEILKILEIEFQKISSFILDKIEEIKKEYDVKGIDRIFITTKYGKIEGLDDFFEKILKIETFSFEFYEKYNLDRLPVDPFLFLSMLETHHSYKTNELDYNFSLFLRPPLFIYRPSGIILLSVVASLVLFSIYPLYIYMLAKQIEKKNLQLEKEVYNLTINKAKLELKLRNLENNKSKIEKEIISNQSLINSIKKFIKDIYKFKYEYLPKSKEIVEISNLIVKNNTYVEKIVYSNNLYKIYVYSYKEKGIPNLIKDLIEEGFAVDFEAIKLKNKKYTSLLRIEE